MQKLFAEIRYINKNQFFRNLTFCLNLKLRCLKKKQMLWSLTTIYLEKKSTSFMNKLTFWSLFIILNVCIVGWFKTPVSSQTHKLMAATKVSDYLGPNHYKKAKKSKHFTHLRLANRPQSLSTYHSILPTVNSGH